MKYLHEEIIREITSVVKSQFENVLFDNIDSYIEFFNSVSDLRESFPDYDENAMILNTENARKICDKIKIQIDKHFERDESLNFENLFPGFVDELDKLFSEIEPIIEIEQSETRFKVINTDSLFVKVAKRIKYPALKFQQLNLKTANVVLRKLKKQPYEIKYWNQQLPLKNVGLHFLRNRLLVNLSVVYENVLKVLSLKSVAFWNYDEEYDVGYIDNFNKNNVEIERPIENPDSILSELNLLKAKINDGIKAAIEKCIQEFDDNCEKAGTIELSKSKFKDSEIEQQLNTIQQNFDKIISEWNNTLYALGEDWELNHDLESNRYSGIEVFFKFGKSLSVKNKVQIYPQFKEISSALNFVTEKLNQPTSDLQDLERMIAFTKESLQKTLLSSTLPNLINSISDLRVPEMLDEASRTVKNHLDSVTEKRVFVKTSSYDHRIKSSDLGEIYPREFISFNALPKFLASLEKIKEECNIDFQNIQSELINLGNMADFGLESAITAAALENLSKSEVNEIALEGIKLSFEKQEQLLVSFQKISENVLKNLRDSAAAYNEEMYSLTQSSKILEINLQLAKAKAKLKATQTRDKLFSSFRNFVPVVIERTKTYYKQGFRFYTDTRKQFGLTETQESITSEISDFLSRASSSVEKLPYIYRRLFQIAPLENDRLYVSRELEESQLYMGYNNWVNGAYAPIIISAEKGGGITSFLNIISKKLEKENTVKRLSIKPTPSNNNEMLKILQDLFLPERFLGIEDFINYLNSQENKQVIIVENLQHMYLRKVKGFLSFKMLIDIISKTNKNIFWITSTTLYANDYLSKTIRLNDIFGYHIKLKQLGNEQIIDLIKKRNSISGYNLEYEADHTIPRKKDFHKLPLNEQQILLEEQFFSSLNKFAQSNISLALLFWLRSIKDMQERKVLINANLEISDTILNSLSTEKIFVLQSLILHDGLRIPDLAKTINYSLQETHQITQILFDDGVLIKNDAVYLINPLLYRQSVTLLKSKNLI